MALHVNWINILMMLVPTPHPKVLVGNKRQVSKILGKYVFSKLHQQLKCGRGNLAEYVTSCSCRVRCAQHFLSICSHMPFFGPLGWKCAYPTDTISYSSQCCWVAPLFACYTKLAVGMVSLWFGIIFHSCYQMDTRWVIAASASALGPPQSPWAWACQLAASKMVLQRNTPQPCTHLFLTLMTLEKNQEKENPCRQAFL